MAYIQWVKILVDNNTKDNDVATCQVCDGEPARYLIDVGHGACPLHKDDGIFNDPLNWWKENNAKCKYCTQIFCHPSYVCTV